MKFGVHYVLRNPARAEWFKPWPSYYAELMEHLTEVDRLGYSSVNFAEHHFDPDGYNNSMIAVMTMAALNTQNCQIGQNILLLPQYHPVRLAEDLATIDIISGGRVTLNAGQVGEAFDDEFLAYGINPRYRPSLLEEGLDIIRRSWTEERFSFVGKRWNLKDVCVYPKPLQKPHPPMFTTTSSDASLERAARMGVGACARGGAGTAPGDKAMWQVWRQKWHSALARYGRKPDEVGTNTFGQLYVTDDPEREWHKHKDAILYRRYYTRFNGTRPYAQMHLGENDTPKPEDLRDWESVFLTPEETIRRMRETWGESAPDEVRITSDNPGIPLADTIEYLRNFAEKVMPHLQELPSKS